MSTLLTIGEVARRAGVRASAIRYYEEAGLLEEPERVSGKRRYDEEALRRLALIGGAKRAGFTLGEIRTLLHGFPAGTGAAQRWQALASKKLDEVDEAIAQLRQTRGLLEEALRCECASLDECARLLYQT
jgi:MerR family transcriptional regulator, redox-sensitive transcriptional activator SoxR